MKKIFYSLCVCWVALGCVSGAVADTFSCGDGYILVNRSNRIDGMVTQECQKLWCKDLETNKSMGNGNTAANGYRATSEPIELKVKKFGSSDDDTISIKCFGERKWCSGEAAGEWVAKYGAYTRMGEDTPAYRSYQKGGCFAWRLEKPECDEPGMVASIKDGKWVCSPALQRGARSSTIRRTSTNILR